MTGDVLDTLTVIESTHIARAIKWVKREIKMRCAEVAVGYSALKWNEFWGYFDRTCIKSYPIEVWNIYGMNNELIARTNNPLERFNRKLNSRFPTPHPSMASFVAVIKTMLAEYVRRVADVPRGCARRIIRERIVLPPVVDTTSDIDSDNDKAFPLPTSVEDSLSISL
ncbi:unnamed protein product [Phytophthora fragariaefolia]|uniref:Unnamed protein product n=1 Tax=Phytophthora fragariaefolia TaxID=1490495 RepID=A0A9W6X0U0_9STRA|nr:unnamed protein product [Phytophthora fragariaefolia]